MANLTEHVMINKWDDDINRAITKVGGDTSGSEGLPDYAEIIETQLVSNEAVGKGIYQDFLFIDDQNETSNYPWDGEPTTSTNAVYASTIASSIKELFNTMASTERFQVLLVDDFPKGEINLSAIYLVRVHCDCGETEKENTYKGCYYIKTGKSIKRIDIPKFEVNLNELFYLTRAEYDAGLSDYVKTIEELLRQKFGKYWDDDGFALDKVLDEMILDVENELKAKTEEILVKVHEDIEKSMEEVQKEIDDIYTTLENRVDEKINDVQVQVDSLKQETETKFETLEGNINERMSTIESDVDKLESDITTKFETLEDNIETQMNEMDTKFTDLTNGINTRIDEFENEVDTELSDIRLELTEFVKIKDLVELNDEINELK